MYHVEPGVFIVAESTINLKELQDYLESIGVKDWSTNAHSYPEEIIEVMGRGCYKSFGTELNSNISKVREGNKPYIENLIKQHHGAVLEHSWVSFMFTNVSRVFTHELVRHRVGTAISQESLRYVRADDLGLWIPPRYRDIPDLSVVLSTHWEYAEKSYNEVLDRCALIEGMPFDNLPFEKKKEYTSFARRVLPIGMTTNIGWSCNMRTLRGVLEQRTSRFAEIEMRHVFNIVGSIARERWPSLFDDYRTLFVDGYVEYNTVNRKI